MRRSREKKYVGRARTNRGEQLGEVDRGHLLDDTLDDHHWTRQSVYCSTLPLRRTISNSTSLSAADFKWSSRHTWHMKYIDVTSQRHCYLLLHTHILCMISVELLTRQWPLSDVIRWNRCRTLDELVDQETCEIGELLAKSTLPLLAYYFTVKCKVAVKGEVINMLLRCRSQKLDPVAHSSWRNESRTMRFSSLFRRWEKKKENNTEFYSSLSGDRIKLTMHSDCCAGYPSFITPSTYLWKLALSAFLLHFHYKCKLFLLHSAEQNNSASRWSQK